MADDNSFPQLPKAAYFKMRSVFARRPRGKFEANSIAVELGVEPVAARQYFKEFRRLQILDEEGGLTNVGKLWRQDEEYESACRKILEQTYPPPLIDLAPPGEATREKAQRWFQSQGLGTGAAFNKASLYVLIANFVRADASEGVAGQETKIKRQAAAASPKGKSQTKRSAAVVGSTSENINHQERDSTNEASFKFPLNLNMQIHISADATLEQIDAIFSSMARHLR
jgi:hypothetical protein